MIMTLEFTDETKESIIIEQEALGFRLIEDQRHFDGNHLIFDDGQPMPVIEPLVFTAIPPGLTIGERVKHIEEWLEKNGVR